METFDEHYLNHLSAVSKNNKVILAENIYNQRGSLAQKIAKHKLLKPLEQSIVLSSNLNQRT